MWVRVSWALAACLAVAVMVACVGCTDEHGDLDIRGRRVAFLVADGVHSGETLGPLDYLRDRGATVTLIGPGRGSVTAYDRPGVTIEVDATVGDVSASEFDALVVPGGPSYHVLRQEKQALDLVRRLDDEGKVIAAICLGPLVLAEAGVVEGRTVTGTQSIRAEMELAGAVWDGSRCVQDGNLITARGPGEIRRFSRAIALALVSEPARSD